MSTRIFIRVIVPSTFKVVKAPRSIATATQRVFRSHNSKFQDVASSPSISSLQERLYSQQATVEMAAPTVDFDYVKEATRRDSILIIDVREPEEVMEHGKIPNSINIPLANVIPVLSNLTDNEFQQMYEKPKPKEDTEIIFYCMIGKRSGKALDNALGLGFKNAKNYLGSWTDWASKTK